MSPPRRKRAAFHHRRRRLVVFLLAHTLRPFRLENVTAQVTAQTCQLVDRGLERRLAHHADAQGRALLFVDLALPTARTAIPWLQRGVRDLDAAGSPIRRRAVSAVPRFRLLTRVRIGWRGRGAFRSGSQARLLQNFARLLRARFRQQRAQAAEFASQVADQTQARRGGDQMVGLARFQARTRHQPASSRGAGQDHPVNSPALESLNHNERLCEVSAA